METVLFERPRHRVQAELPLVPQFVVEEEKVAAGIHFGHDLVY